MLSWIHVFDTINIKGEHLMIAKKFILGYIAMITLLVILLTTVSASLWIQYEPTEMNPQNRLLAPSSEHWLGTDHFGRDIFSRIVYGARVSLLVGISTAVSVTVLGIVFGLLAGFYRRLDQIIMRIVDGLMAFPSILLAIALVAVLGGSLQNIIIALTFAYAPFMVRVVRSSTLQLKNMQYIEAANASGTSNQLILLKHILPNAVTPIIVQATFLFADSILAEAALSFLGVGVEPSTNPTWGNMLGESRVHMTSSPWFAIFPGFAIVTTVLSLNMIGDMLRDYLDPRSIHQNKRQGFLSKTIEKITVSNSRKKAKEVKG
jgi:peptide/nickel transport system permease protein